VQPIDTLAIVGEVLSWIGLGVGIPALLIAAMIRLAEGRWQHVDIAVVDRAGEPFARWFAGGDFHERPLHRRERADADWHRGYVSSRDPSHVRLDPPVLHRALMTVGAVFAGVGIVGFVVSFVPAFV
jgi:hypothetical protein